MKNEEEEEDEIIAVARPKLDEATNYRCKKKKKTMGEREAEGGNIYTYSYAYTVHSTWGVMNSLEIALGDYIYISRNHRFGVLINEIVFFFVSSFVFCIFSVLCCCRRSRALEILMFEYLSFFY